MSISIVSEVEAQIHSYLNHQNTLALAKTSKDLYHIILCLKLRSFCKENNIQRLDETFMDHMPALTIFLRDQDLSAQTTQQYLTIVKVLMKFLGHPVEFTYRIPRQDKQAFDLKHQKRWFSDREIAMCKTYQFKRNHARNHVLVRLFLETGARINEIAHIRRGDVSTIEETILLGHSKTVPRSVFFSQETAIYIERFFHAKFPDPAIDSFKKIFPGKNRIYKIINAMLLDLGLKTKGDGRGPHTFRHYTATDLHYNRNMELTHVAALLGDTPDTISSRYLHPTAQMLHGKIKKASGWS